MQAPGRTESATPALCGRPRELIDHPDVGHIPLDCDTLVAEPDTEDAERLSLAVVLGTQSLVE
jgi:hypothetical protein